MNKNHMKIATVILIVGAVAYSVYVFLQESGRARMEQHWSGQRFAARDYYPLTPGNKWTYRISGDDEQSHLDVEITQRVQWQGRDAVRVTFNDAASKILGFAESGLVKYQEIDDGEQEVYDPPGSILPDLTFGESRVFHPKYVMQTADAEVATRAAAEMSFWLDTIESVKVPAGTFRDVLKVGYYDRWEEEDGSFDISRGYIWFARGVGIVKIKGSATEVDPESGRRETEKEMHVLVSYHIAGDAREGRSE